MSSKTSSTGESAADKMKTFIFTVGVASVCWLAMIGAQLYTIVIYFANFDKLKYFNRSRSSIDPFGVIALALFIVGLVFGKNSDRDQKGSSSEASSQIRTNDFRTGSQRTPSMRALRDTSGGGAELAPSASAAAGTSSFEVPTAVMVTGVERSDDAQI